MKPSFLRSFVTLGALLSFISSVGFADSISPSSLSLSLNKGASTTITKTVTVSKGTPTSSKVDVFFLADETGSMGGSIGSVKSAASDILTGASGLGDVSFGVGGYRDNGDAFVYHKLQDITNNLSLTSNAINSWYASMGGDWEEAELYALKQVATTTSWRSGSERLAIWFGDAPGHDPAGPDGTTQAQTISALNAAGVSVLAIDVGGMDSYDQASGIASATGGKYYSGIDTSTIVATISASILSAVESYSLVGLDLSEVPAGIEASILPLAYSGFWDRSIDRSFTFDVTFKGATTGVYDFNIYGTVDHGRVATESDHIAVRSGCSAPDASATLALLGSALAGLVIIRRRRA